MMTKGKQIYKQILRHCGLKLMRHNKLFIGTIVIITILGHVHLYYHALDLRGEKQFPKTNNKEREVISNSGDQPRGENVTNTVSKSGNMDLGIFAKTDKYPTDGYERADYLRKVCTTGSFQTQQSNVRVFYNYQHNVVFCPLCKRASTFWTRVIKMLDFNKIKQPFEITIPNAKVNNFYFNTTSKYISVSEKLEPEISAKDAFKFSFVRNPFSLLLSAYVDKIVGPNPTYWIKFKTTNNLDTINHSSNTCGADLTFGQFLQNIVKRYKINHTLDCHVSTFDACQPCAMNYTYVGQFETFKEDTFHILSKLNQTQTLEIFEDQFSSLHADDAIKDSTSGPFSWKSVIIKCIPWSEALQRIWRKLQIRGIIGMQRFPLSDQQAEKIRERAFLKLLRQTRSKTMSKERRWQKRQAFIQAFQTVHSDVLRDIRGIYSRQFKLFRYSNRYIDVFKNDMPLQNFNFFNYSNIKQNFP